MGLFLRGLSWFLEVPEPEDSPTPYITPRLFARLVLLILRTKYCCWRLSPITPLSVQLPPLVSRIGRFVRLLHLKVIDLCFPVRLFFRQLFGRIAFGTPSTSSNGTSNSLMRVY